MTPTTTKSRAPLDWQYVFLGAAVSIAGTAFAGTAMFNLVSRLLAAQGASQQEIYSYFVSPSLTLAGVVSLVYSAMFGFACGRVATMRTRRRSLLSGAIAGLAALSFQGVMALGLTPDARAQWQVLAGVLVPFLASTFGAGSRSDA